jgi:hypothetical protein
MKMLVVILALAMVVLSFGLSPSASAGQDGPGQSVKVDLRPTHPKTPPIIPFGQDGPGQ